MILLHGFSLCFTKDVNVFETKESGASEMGAGSAFNLSLFLSRGDNHTFMHLPLGQKHDFRQQVC